MNEVWQGPRCCGASLVFGFFVENACQAQEPVIDFLSFCLLDGLREGSRKGTLSDLQYRIDKAVRTSTSAQAGGEARRGEASDDLSHPGTMLGVALLELDESRVDVEYGASPVQTDRACQESEQIAKLITTPCSSQRQAHHNAMLIPAPEAMFTPERNRRVEGAGVRCRIEWLRLPGQGDDRLHRRVVRGPTAVELGDVDAGP